MLHKFRTMRVDAPSLGPQLTVRLKHTVDHALGLDWSTAAQADEAAQPEHHALLVLVDDPE